MIRLQLKVPQRFLDSQTGLLKANASVVEASPLDAAAPAPAKLDATAANALVEAILDEVTLEEVKADVQQAIMLEHSTIPPYLFALYSLKAGQNTEISALVKSVVMEEMLHMALASNILNAIGGEPVINKPGFIPQYPADKLPGGVHSGLVVPLAKFSKELLEQVFMVIETPEDPLQFPHIETHIDTNGELGYSMTIGTFYKLLNQKLERLETQVKNQDPTATIFTGDTSKQLAGGFGGDLIAVTDLASASQAINTIIEQGEGTSTTPMDDHDEPAHYYRYEEIVKGNKLIASGDSYAYAGDPIPFDETGVYNLMENPSVQKYTDLLGKDPAASRALNACNTFNYTYTSLLNSLHLTFNGDKGQLRTAIGVMESLKQLMIDMADITLADGTAAAPSFEYLPVNPYPTK